jgi:chemotaxis protein methyltransferase CheR
MTPSESRAAHSPLKQAANPAAQTRREPPAQLTDGQFKYLSDLAESQAGIVLSESKRPMLYARLTRRLNELKLNSFEVYIDRLKDNDQEELGDFRNRVTTNLTYFNREPGHFEFLKREALPAVHARKKANEPLRIWSAGCSTGQEPFTLAMTVQSTQACQSRETRILCTDLNTKVLQQAATGRYKLNELRGLTDQQLSLWFKKTPEQDYQCDPRLLNMLIFKQLNLLEPWPIKHDVDVIFCRNVLIYFNSNTHEELLNRFAKLLAIGGYLFLGHSESLTFAMDHFKRVSSTVYERVR